MLKRDGIIFVEGKGNWATMRGFEYSLGSFLIFESRSCKPAIRFMAVSEVQVD
jgi:hypothetical protein